MNSWTVNMTLSAFLLWFATFSPAERVALTAAFLVFVGVAGEYIIEVPAIEERERLGARIKRFAMAVLLLGLAGDVLGIVMSQSEMAALTREAGDANKSANEARVASASAKSDAKIAHDEADAAKTVSGEAKSIADTAEHSAEKALRNSTTATTAASNAQQKSEDVNRRLVEANKQLEDVETKRARLEKDLKNLAICSSPRVIFPWAIGQKTAVDSLRPFARRVNIEFIPDAEARRAALSLAGALQRAGWTIVSLTPKDRIIDGVEIDSFMATPARNAPIEEVKSLIAEQRRSEEVVDAVLGFLHSFNWQARSGLALDEKGKLIPIPSDTLLIKVGLYPPVWYFTPPGAKEFDTLLAEIEGENENDENSKAQAQAKADRLARNEETIRRLPPDIAASFKTMMDDMEKMENREEQRHFNPCQPLTRVFPYMR